MKWCIYSLIFLFLLPGFISCKKEFLNIDNTALYRQTYVKDLKTMDQFLNGIYINLGSNMEFAFGAVYPELIADNMKLKTLTDNTLIPHYGWAQKTDELDNDYRVGVDVDVPTAVNPIWKTGYVIIRACSFVIEEIEKYKSEDPVKADNIKGQAYAIRALMHFKLVNTFAQAYSFTEGASHPGVPYITPSDITQPFTRQSVSEVYGHMIEDFQKAIELIQPSANDTRLLSRAAAKALLARIYLYKEDYTQAKSLALELASQFPLMATTAGYPNDLFKYKAPSQTEIIFQLTPQNASITTRTQFAGWFLQGSSQRFLATSDIATLLVEDPNDVRKAWVTNSSGNWTISKFPLSAAPEIKPAIAKAEGAYYSPVIRSSEMFLTVAEAAAKTGDENTARTYLDAIRKRANPSKASIVATGGALIDSIYKERRKELAFESLRMYDLQRWKKAVRRTDVLQGFPTELPYPSDKAIAPIPPQDVRLAGIPQNAGY